MLSNMRLLSRPIRVISCAKRFCSSSSAVRVRFAPSPTGFLHLGSLRTAFYNYLFARQNGGKFILRIEDTDKARTVAGAVDEIERILSWAGLSPDESPSLGGNYGPYLQSERVALYKDYADQLIRSGHAYRCFCSEMRLELVRKEAAKNREIPRYDNRCRHLTKEEVEEKLANGESYTVRLKLVEGDISFDDIVYGTVSIDLSTKEADPIILKSDGFPTYHLANVVDDHLMEITHVLRGVEWQTSTPKHIMLYNALNWPIPHYAHLPLIMNRDGTKLSKRQNDIQLESMRRQGYLPEAVTSYLSKIGGGFGRQELDEVLSLERLSNDFKLEKVNTHSCRIDPTKLLLYNRLAIERQLSGDSKLLIDELRKRLEERFGKGFDSTFDDSELQKWLDWGKERTYFVSDLVNNFDYIWACPKFNFETAKLEKSLGDLGALLEDTICFIDELKEAAFASKTDAFKGFCAQRNLPFKKYMQLLRFAATNSKEGPPIAEMLDIFGTEKFCKYLKEAINYVNNSKNLQKAKI